jgi:hypothetical protein
MNDMKSQTADTEATLQFLADGEGLAAYIASEGGGEIAPHQGNYLMQPVLVHDGRDRDPAFDLEREGFVLLSHKSRVKDFYDDDEIASVYEDEVRELVKDRTGARRVEIFDHTRRATSDNVRKEKEIREPASIVHNDYTPDSGPRRLRDFFSEDPEKADALLERRFAIVNVWRPVKGPVQNHPLAFCDASSIAPGDLIPVKRVAKDRIGEIQLSLYNAGHRWYYFPSMTTDELLVFKTYDSAVDGRACFTPHTSFDDPGAVKDAPPRESLETRCFVFF